jgi:hypothetical protein
MSIQHLQSQAHRQTDRGLMRFEQGQEEVVLGVKLDRAFRVGFHGNCASRIVETHTYRIIAP